MTPLTTQLLGALRLTLRDLPPGATQVRIDDGPAGCTTLRLVAPTGDLVTCVVAQRATRPRGHQLALPLGATPPAAGDTPAALPAPPSATAADTRVSIAEAEWDALADDARGLLSEPSDGCTIDWQGAVGFVTALVPDEALAALRGACEGYGVTLWEGDVPPIPSRRAAAKAPAPPTRARKKAPAPEPEAPVPPPPLPTHWVTVAGWEAADPGVLRDLALCAWRGQWTRDPSGRWTGAVVEAGDVAALRAVCEAYGLALYEGTTPPTIDLGLASPDPSPAKQGRSKKATPPAKRHREQRHALDGDSWMYPNKALLVIGAPGEKVRHTVRPSGLQDAAWRELVQEVVATTRSTDPGGADAVFRLYSAKGVCVWDSRDGGRL